MATKKKSVKEIKAEMQKLKSDLQKAKKEAKEEKKKQFVKGFYDYLSPELIKKYLDDMEPDLMYWFGAALAKSADKEHTIESLIGNAQKGLLNHSDKNNQVSTDEISSDATGGSMSDYVFSDEVPGVQGA